MREDLDKERKFKGRQWAKRETQILAVIESTVRRITTACGDIIHTRTRRMFAFLPAIHRGQKGNAIFHIKSQAIDVSLREILFLAVILHSN
jgi:hypothetical protein